MAADDVVVDPPGGEANRVRDCPAGGVAVRDHGEAPEAQQVGASVGVGVEPVPETPRGGPDQGAAELAARGRRDIIAKGIQEIRDRPLEQLEDDIAGEAVGDDDVGGALEDVAALGVSSEVEIARRQELVRLERELVSLLGLLADREQPDLRIPDVEYLRGEDRTHVGELDEVLRTSVGVGAGVEQDASIAPVLPAETTAAAFPSPTARQAATRELFGFARTASVGFSSMAMTSGASISSRP